MQNPRNLFRGAEADLSGVKRISTSLHFDVLAFDADDTLWQNEHLYQRAQARFAEILAPYQPAEPPLEALARSEGRNLQSFGYGIKGFTLSMIETAVTLTQGRFAARDVQAIIELARDMLTARVELLDGVAETIPLLAARYRLMLVTKGDLLDQEGKIARSGLEAFFQDIEILSAKNRESYRRVLVRYAIPPERFIMVGNSLKSDILPVLETGGSAVYIPHEATWAHENADPPPDDHPGFYSVPRFSDLPALLNRLEENA